MKTMFFEIATACGWFLPAKGEPGTGFNAPVVWSILNTEISAATLAAIRKLLDESTARPAGLDGVVKGEPGTGVRAPVLLSIAKPEMLFDAAFDTNTNREDGVPFPPPVPPPPAPPAASLPPPQPLVMMSKKARHAVAIVRSIDFSCRLAIAHRSGVLPATCSRKSSECTDSCAAQGGPSMDGGCLLSGMILTVQTIESRRVDIEIGATLRAYDQSSVSGRLAATKESL
jgi:hypothetical protein